MKFWSGVVTEKVQASRDFYVRLFEELRVIGEANGDLRRIMRCCR